ncbi:MAG: hypothetical protein JW768_14275 [Chitinispirillaceae bacterium]|nr:hypothetical protein [Chitinispirillaceae bacterium]
MNRLTLFAAMLLVSFAAGGMLRADTIMVAGQARTYVLHVPSGLSNPALVINMHGLTGTGSQQQMYSRMDRVADQEKFIAVYPDGLANTWDVSGNQDVDFIKTLIDTLYARHGIDRNRVYATGFSMGGFMSYRLACAAADVIAAVAPVAGLLMGSSRNCTPPRPVSVLHIHGTADSTVRYSGVASTISGWLTRNGCPETPTITKPYPETNPNSVVTKEHYGPCNQGTEVVLMTLEGVGHLLPSNTSTMINASEEAWRFFKNHTLTGAAVFPARSLAAAAKEIIAWSTPGAVHIRGVHRARSIRIVDTKGRVAVETAITGPDRCRHSSLVIPFERWTRGVYIVVIADEAVVTPLKVMMH